MTTCAPPPIEPQTQPKPPRPAAAAHDARPLAGWLLLAGCLLAAVVGRMVYLTQPFDSDAAIFIYMGKLVTQGTRYGHDIVDNKLPTVGMVTSVVWRAFGSSWPAYIFLQTALAIAAAYWLARTAAAHIGSHARRPTFLFALVYLNFTPVVFGGFQLETLQVFFAIIAAAAALDALRHDDARDAFLVGLAGGLAAMMKPTGLAVVGAFAVAVLWRSIFDRTPRRISRPISHAAAAGLGLLIPLAAVISYLAATDVLQDMPSLFRQIARYAANSVTDVALVNKFAVVLLIAGFPFLVRGIIFRSAVDRSTSIPPPGTPRSRSAHALLPPRRRTLFIFACAWLALETAGVVAQHRMYAYHFMVMAPPLALLFGLLPRHDRVMPLAAALAPIALLSLGLAGYALATHPLPPARLPASDYLLPRTLPGDYVWTDDVPRLILETDLRSATRHPLTFLFANWDTAPLEYAAVMLDDFRRHRPVYLILPADMERYLHHQTANIAELSHFPLRAQNYSTAWRSIDAYARAHYHREATLGAQTVWRRNATVPSTDE